jgi:hypothetical protein
VISEPASPEALPEVICDQRGSEKVEKFWGGHTLNV